MTVELIPAMLMTALLSDDAMCREVIEKVREAIDVQVILLADAIMQSNVNAVLAKALPTFILVGTSHDGGFALEAARAMPLAMAHRVCKEAGAAQARALADMPR